MTENPADGRKRGPYAKSAARRRQIIEAAYRHFAMQGYNGTSLRDIASAADVSLSSIQHHFADKEGLLVAVLTYRDEIGAAPLGADMRFDRRIVARADENMNVPGIIGLFTTVAAEAVSAAHPAHEFFHERNDRLRAEFTNELRSMEKAGLLRPDIDPEMAAALLLAVWEGIQLQWLYTPDMIDPPAGLRSFFALLAGSDFEPGEDAKVKA